MAKSSPVPFVLRDMVGSIGHGGVAGATHSAVTGFCREAATEGVPAAALAVFTALSPAVALPVVAYGLAFGGSLYLKSRSDRKDRAASEAALRAHFSEVADALDAHARDAEAGVRMIEAIHDRRRFVWARLDGRNQEHLAARLRVQVEGLLIELDLDDRLDDLSTLAWDSNWRVRDVQANQQVTHEKLDDIASLVASLSKSMGTSDAPGDPPELSEEDRAAVERLKASEAAESRYAAAVAENDQEAAEAIWADLAETIRRTSELCLLRGTQQFFAGHITDSIEAFSTLIHLPGATIAVRTIGFFNRGVCKGRLDPPDHPGEVDDYNSVLRINDASAVQKAKALVNRGFTKRQLNPPDLLGAIDDSSAVLQMNDAPAELKASALLNRGIAKGQLDPSDLLGEIDDCNAVLLMNDALAAQRAKALVNRGHTKGQLNPPDLVGAIDDCNAVLLMDDAPDEQKANALFNRGFTKGQLDPPDFRGAIVDYNAVLQIDDAPDELKASALVNRGIAKGQLNPPDLLGAIDDSTAVLLMDDAPAKLKAKALVNRGHTKGELDPPDLLGAIDDCNAVLLMDDASDEQKANAIFNRGFTKGQLDPPDLLGKIDDYNAVLQIDDAPDELKANALVNRGIAKCQLAPPEFLGAIDDYNAVLQIKDASDELKAMAFFNLACEAASRLDVSEAVANLRGWADVAERPRRAVLDGDADLDPIRDHPAFVDFRATLPE